MIPPPLSAPVAAAVSRSADLLARGMVADLGHDAGLAPRVAVERFVAGCAAWAAAPDDERPPAPGLDLVERALRVIARWEGALAFEAAAWQLALSALAIAARPAPRRAAGEPRGVP